VGGGGVRNFVAQAIQHEKQEVSECDGYAKGEVMVGANARKGTEKSSKTC